LSFWRTLVIVGGYRVGPLLKGTGKEILADDLTGLAAEAAYNFFFSIFPFFLLAGSLFGLLANGEQTANWILDRLARAVPGPAQGIVTGIVHDIVFAKNAPGVLSIGAIFTAWSGATVFRSLMDALNRTYDVTETRPIWKRALLSLAALISTGILLVITSTIMIAGPEIIAWIGRHIHLERASVHVWTVAQYPIAITFLVCALFLIYRFLPNLQQSAKQIFVGSTAAAVLWIGITLLFRMYVANFGSYNKTYGTIGAVMALLTWMYLSMLVILAGGELNAELHRGTGAVNPRKGAVYEGRIITDATPSRSSVDRPAPLLARDGTRGDGAEHHGGPARG
jgi:membrane protein